MDGLNLPTYSFNIKSKEGKQLIYDEIRRQYITLTPEEWVRQNIIRFLVQERNFPLSLMSVEHYLKVGGRVRRCDVVVFSRRGTPVMIIECKASDVPVSQATLDQVASYNTSLKVDYLVVTNLRKTFACKMDYSSCSYRFIDDIPRYDLIESGCSS